MTKHSKPPAPAPAPPVKDKPKSATSLAAPIPTFSPDLSFLDSSLIPSLPPPGGTIGHHELMGHTLRGNGYGSMPMPALLPLPLALSQGPPIAMSNDGSREGLRPGMLRRSSSYEDRPLRDDGAEGESGAISGTRGGGGNRAGVGAGAGSGIMAGVGVGIGTRSNFSNSNFSTGPTNAARAGAGNGHMRNRSAGSAETVRQARAKPNSHFAQQQQNANRPRPGMIRRTSSMEMVHGSSIGRKTSSDVRETKGTKHTRTYSDSETDSHQRGSGPKPRGASLSRTAVQSSTTSVTATSASSAPHMLMIKAPPRSHSHSNSHGRDTSSSLTSSQFNAATSASGENKNETVLLDLTHGQSGESTKKLIKTLTTLLALTPQERIPYPPPPPPSGGSFSPLSILTPLAILLEALVCEREVLKGSRGARLPLMRDGTSLQLFRRAALHTNEGEGDEEGEGEGGGEGESGGELNWDIMRAYILAVGTVLDSLLPHLRDYASRPTPSSASTTKTKTSTNKEEKILADLLKTLRTYVAKTKKVFGQVAQAYVEEYGYLRGWWDESGMKGAAGEVGRWGDLFDA